MPPGNLDAVVDPAADSLIAPILDHLDRDDPGQVAGDDMYGSAPSLAGAGRDLLERARAGYLGLAAGDWTALRPAAEALARTLAVRAQRPQ